MPKVAPAISDAERDVLIQAMSAFTVQQIRELLREHHLPIGGTKDELISRLDGALSDGAVAAGEVVGFLDRVVPLMDTGVIRPVIHMTFPLEAASKAHTQLEEGTSIGKIVLTVD